MSVQNNTQDPPWKAGLRSARANLVPGLVLQAVALAIVLAYYFHAPTRALFGSLVDVRTRTGFFFGVVSTGLFGGLVPFLVLRLSPESRPHHRWTEGLWFTVFWGYKGFEIELLYRLMAHFIGQGHDVFTIAAKTTVDQLIYCPIYAVPGTVLAYKWCAVGFATRIVWDDFRAPGWYGRTVLPTLVANMALWIPAVAIIYALPTPLQLPMQNLVLVFFTLILAHLNRRRR